MFFVDRPYVSDFFKTTVKEHGIPVVDTPAAREIGLLPGTRLIAEADALAGRGTATPLYMTSENAIGRLDGASVFAPLRAAIDAFKDKAKFREITRPLFPDFFFRAVPFADLAQIDPETLPLPCVVKPSVGFFSMGVHRVDTPAGWRAAVAAIAADIARVRGLYPASVLDAGTFLIEQCIEGEEFAVDAYFDADGAPVVLGVYRHMFSSADDVGDRIYLTSKAIVRDNLAALTGFLARIGAVTGSRSFPVHVELRRTATGALRPIEVNPMRFGGWCTTADVTSLAHGINPYLLYFKGEKPDWTRILDTAGTAVHSIVVLDNSTGYAAEEIAAFDYDALLAGFEKPLELRRIDYAAYPVFGFLFAETRADNMAELQRILRSDLREFTRLRETAPAS